MFCYYGKRSSWDLRRLPAILDLPLICLKKVLEDFAAVSTTFEVFLLGTPSVFRKSDQETADEQHLSRQEKKEKILRKASSTY